MKSDHQNSDATEKHIDSNVDTKIMKREKVTSEMKLLRNTKTIWTEQEKKIQQISDLMLAIFMVTEIKIKAQSLILHQMLTFEGGLNLRKIEADGFLRVTVCQPKR